MADTSDATFLFADLAGFTALTEAHGDLEGADVAVEFCRRVEDLLPATGELIKTIGDAAMVRCTVASDAIALGLHIADALGGRHGFASVRVGMHHGPAVERHRDWFGSTVNIAARVAGVAAGGQVIATEDVVKASTMPAGVRLVALGPHVLRNVARPVKMFALESPNRIAAACVTDPVCRMSVDPAQAAAHLRVKGRAFWFCSGDCAALFMQDPQQYTSGAS